VRSREEILGLGHKLFKVLTGQELHGIDLEIKEGFATNTQATQTMQQLVTFSDRQDIAAQQHLIIPLNKALTKYRDILYEATENRKDKDRMSST
jgi:hypothetical protein